MLLSFALMRGLDHWIPFSSTKGQWPGSWLRGVKVHRGTASIDFRPLRPISSRLVHCGVAIWLSEVMRTALQFEEIDRVRFLIDGDCRKFRYFEGDPRACTGFERSSFEKFWGRTPKIEPQRIPDGLIFYEANCAGITSDLRVYRVRVPEGHQAVLTAAIHELVRYWYRHAPRLQARAPDWVDIRISDGIAILDWQSLWHLGWASTSCGSVGFGEGLVRTALQFPTVEGVQLWYRGSCERLDRWMQGSGICMTTVRSNTIYGTESVEA